MDRLDADFGSRVSTADSAGDAQETPSSDTTVTCQALVQAWVSARDEHAFSTLVERYAPIVRTTCTRILRDPALADDATQETFLRLARHAAQIQSSPGGWLVTCARTASLDLLSQSKARRSRELAVGAEQTHGGQTGASADPDELAALDQALADLDEADRGLLIDYFWRGRTQGELGRDAGISQVAIKKRIDRAIERMRMRMRRYAPAALVALLIAAAPEPCSAGEASLLASLHERGLPTPEPAPNTILARTSVRILASVALLLCAGGLILNATTHRQDVESVPAPAAPAAAPAATPWWSAWKPKGLRLASADDNAIRLDSGFAQVGTFLHPLSGGASTVTIHVEHRHCPFFGIALVAGQEDDLVVQLSVRPDKRDPAESCWVRTPGEHTLGFRLETAADGGTTMITTVDGTVTGRHAIAMVPTHAALVVCSGDITLRRPADPRPAQPPPF